jgi:hypothetical protein
MSFPPVPNTEIKSDNVWLSWFRRIYEIFSRWIVVSVSSILLNNPLVRQAVNRNGPTRFESINADPGTSATSFYQASNGTNSVIMVMHGTGHSGGSANQGWVYTTTAVPLILGTNGGVRIFIDGTGWVAIGASSRSGIGSGVDLLAVNGNIGFTRQLNATPGAGNPLEIVNRSNGSVDIYPNNVFVLSAKATGATRLIPTSTPASPQAGDMYYDSSTNKHRGYNGTTWVDFY